MLYVLSSTLKDGHAKKFSEWAPEAEKRFAAAIPKGWRFKGIYLTAFGLGSTEAEIHWEIDTYAAFDSAVDLFRSGGDYARVVTEYFTHVDPGSQRGRVLRAVTDPRLQLVKHEAVALAL